MNKSSTKISKQILIQRNYLIFMAYHYLDMSIKDIESIFGIKKQAIFNLLKDSNELQKK